MTTHDQAFVRLSDGARLSFAVLGDVALRTPILLNRPLGGSMDLWRSFADHLARAYPVIMFDPRGVGHSSHAPLLRSTRMMARDAVELLAALHVARAHVFGLSLGGMVACWVAVDAPERVSRLVLASTLPAARSLRHKLAQLFRLGSTLLTPHHDAEAALVHGILSHEFRRAQPSQLVAIDRSLAAHPTSPRNLVALGLAAARHDARACLRHIRADTLILFGARDPLAGVSTQRELLGEIPHAVLEVIPGSGHDISLEQPQLAAARILAFLEQADR